MFDYLNNYNPVLLAFIATCFTWFLTALGSSLVFFFSSIKPKVLDAMLGFAAGVMIAASFWSLLAPAIEMSEIMGEIPWLPALVGFVSGGIFLKVIDKIIPHLHLNEPIENAEGIETSWHRSILLVLAITLHNIPEGLAIGVAFGAAAAGMPAATISGAIILAIGIGIQNFPEGAAVSVPLRREGFTRFKSFWYGQLSGIVEPFAAVIGAASVYFIQPLLPYALSFAAGAMIYVVIEELIPESQTSGNSDIATLGTIVGFSIMMVLDVALG
ncbi:MAG: ZIP family metal transporter [Vulcanibacillus sp.]